MREHPAHDDAAISVQDSRYQLRTRCPFAFLENDKARSAKSSLPRAAAPIQATLDRSCFCGGGSACRDPYECKISVHNASGRENRGVHAHVLDLVVQNDWPCLHPSMCSKWPCSYADDKRAGDAMGGEKAGKN